MENEQRDIILFMGQSGIKVKECLKKVVGSNCRPTIVSVEQKMPSICGKKFLEILSAPPRIQESRWSKTFDGIQSRLSSLSGTGQYVFLTFHASWYHQRKREFLSPTDFTKLVDLKDRVRMVIVFIDDCYDIYRRLMMPGEMYEYILGLCKTDPRRALLESITNLLTILEWREIEIAFSRKIAQLVGVPLYIMAVKHPRSMLLSLIKGNDGQRIFYLSHPISGVISEPHPRAPGFYHELNGFIEEVLSKHNRILFLPDAIDEKGRVKRDRVTKRYVPELLEGWPLPFPDDWLFVPLPSEVKHINPLNPGNLDLAQAEEGFQVAVAVLLELLVERISHQINSRDLSLVEQSKDGVLLYRPYWAASTPGGVEEELRHNSRLAADYGEGKRRTIIINAREDLAKWRIGNLFVSAEHTISLNETDLKKLNDLRENWLKDNEIIEKFEDIETIEYNRRMIIDLVEKVLPDKYEFRESSLPRTSSTLRPAAMLDEVEKRSRGWEIIFESALQKDTFREKYIAREQDKYIICPEEELRQELPRIINEIL